MDSRTIARYRARDWPGSTVELIVGDVLDHQGELLLVGRRRGVRGLSELRPPLAWRDEEPAITGQAVRSAVSTRWRTIYSFGLPGRRWREWRRRHVAQAIDLVVSYRPRFDYGARLCGQRVGLVPYSWRHAATVSRTLVLALTCISQSVRSNAGARRARTDWSPYQGAGPRFAVYSLDEPVEIVAAIEAASEWVAADASRR